jgi:hypothetical protein
VAGEKIVKAGKMRTNPFLWQFRAGAAKARVSYELCFVKLLEKAMGGCDCLHCMATMTKEKSVTLRLTKPEKSDLEAAATLTGQPPGTLAGIYVKEGVRRSRFPSIEFRDGAPGRVAYVTGTRWPVWMVVDLVADLSGDTSKAAKRLEKPEPVVKEAIAYAEAYPDEIAAGLALHARRDFEGLKAVIPNLEKL